MDPNSQNDQFGDFPGIPTNQSPRTLLPHPARLFNFIQINSKYYKINIPHLFQMFIKISLRKSLNPCKSGVGSQRVNSETEAFDYVQSPGSNQASHQQMTNNQNVREFDVFF